MTEDELELDVSRQGTLRDTGLLLLLGPAKWERQTMAAEAAGYANGWRDGAAATHLPHGPLDVSPPD